MTGEGGGQNVLFNLFWQSFFFISLNVLAGASATLFNVLNSYVMSDWAFAQFNIALSLTLTFGAVTAAFAVATTADISKTINSSLQSVRSSISSRRLQSFFLAVVLATGSMIIANFETFSVNYLHFYDIFAIGLVVFSAQIFSTEVSILHAFKLWQLAGILGFLISFSRILFVLALPDTLHLTFVVLAGIFSLNIALAIIAFIKSSTVTSKQQEPDNRKKTPHEVEQGLQNKVGNSPLKEGDFKRTMLAMVVFNILLSVDVLVMSALFDEQELIDYAMAAVMAKIPVGLIMTICSFILPYISGDKQNFAKSRLLGLSLFIGLFALCIVLWVTIVFGYSEFGHLVHPTQHIDVNLILPELTTLYIIFSMLYAMEIYMVGVHRAYLFLLVAMSFIFTVVITIAVGLTMEHFILVQLVVFFTTGLAGCGYAFLKSSKGT